MLPLVCPHCRSALQQPYAALVCVTCHREYPIDNGVADFAEGSYYDSFDEATFIPAEHAAGLELEKIGTAARIEHFYAPLITARAGNVEPRVLDLGCGNGLAVDLLDDREIEGWGLDLSALRKWQWRERRRRDRLVVASALRTPFPDGFFDVVISSGVLEHIGVSESGGESYSVEPLPQRDELRREYCREVLRIVRPGGIVFFDFPNGSFPVDFWHGGSTGGARWHSTDEGFLPTYADVRGYFDAIDATVTMRALSPHGRLRCRQVRRHWYGRLFWLPVQVWLGVMALPPLRFLARSPLNPFLVIEIGKSSLDREQRGADRSDREERDNERNE